MVQTITITTRWQIHIPVAVRKFLGLKKPGKVNMKTQRGKLIVTPVKGGILSLGGSLHHLYKKKPINIERVRDYVDYSDL